MILPANIMSAASPSNLDIEALTEAVDNAEIGSSKLVVSDFMANKQAGLVARALNPIHAGRGGVCRNILQNTIFQCKLSSTFPPELREKILGYLDAKELGVLERVSRGMQAIVHTGYQRLNLMGADNVARRLVLHQYNAQQSGPSQALLHDVEAYAHVFEGDVENLFFEHITCATPVEIVEKLDLLTAALRGCVEEVAEGALLVLDEYEAFDHGPNIERRNKVFRGQLLVRFLCETGEAHDMGVYGPLIERLRSDDYAIARGNLRMRLQEIPEQVRDAVRACAMISK